MRSSLALLLMLLPALLLPAGAMLRICACDEWRPARQQPTCCSAPEVVETERMPSCCSGHGTDPRGELPTASAEDCHCRVVPLSDEGPGTPPPLPFAWLPPMPTPQPVFVQMVQPEERLAAPAAQSRAPPPFARRNLPLRL